MPERDPLSRLASRLARGEEIDWDAEERAATTDDARAGIRALRTVAAMAIVNRALLSGVSGEDLSKSISQAQSLTGQSGAPSSAAPSRALAPGTPSHAPAPAAALPPGSRWGQLEVFECVGTGAFGTVYRARDTRLDREVALKILSRDISDPRDEVVREARLLALVRNPNVVTVFGADRIDGQVGIWTEFLRGQTLDHILEERGVLDGREAALIGIDLCRALAAVHAAGIVHQDVKLSNVMRAAGGRIVLMDFGLGREFDPSFGRGGQKRALSGTPHFMAPEVLGGAPSEARCDLYSLGVVLFALVAGSLPVEASTLEDLRAKHARGERKHARDLRPDLAESFVRVLDRALSSDPGARYQTAGEFERALLECLGAPAGVSAAPAAQPPLTPQPSRTAVPHRLPAESDAFVGREEELGNLAARFGGGARLVTLLGPGGIGKTRLAIRYAWRSLDEWAGGVWFCDLTEAKNKDGIASAVGEGLGVPLGTGDVVTQLGHAIAGRGRCCVILDNFEQVVELAGETVAPWLARAPEAMFVVTSRERLRLAGESVQSIESLPLERGVELFVERARRQRPIEPGGPETISIRELVRLVDGIPLAIELSAARFRVMTAAQIVDRIAERFRILARSGTGRHATLRAAIDGSWDLLAPREQAAFAECSVFEGGFSLGAAEGVLDLEPWPDAPWVVDVLQSLVEKSLVRSWVPGEGRGAAGSAMRFGMFVNLQEYAREKLAEAGSIPVDAGGAERAKSAERRHALWFARFGRDDAIDALDRHGGVERRKTLAPELDNLIAACRRMAARGDGETAVACYRAAWAVLELKGPFAVAVDLGAGVLESSLAREDRALALSVLGQAKQRSGRIEEARADFEAWLAIARDAGDRRGEGRAIALLATLALNEGRIEDAKPLLVEALAVHRDEGDRRAEGIALGNLGLALHEQGRMEEASNPRCRRRRRCEALRSGIRRGERLRRGAGLVGLGDRASRLRHCGLPHDARPPVRRRIRLTRGRTRRIARPVPAVEVARRRAGSRERRRSCRETRRLFAVARGDQRRSRSVHDRFRPALRSLRDRSAGRCVFGPPRPRSGKRRLGHGALRTWTVVRVAERRSSGRDGLGSAGRHAGIHECRDRAGGVPQPGRVEEPSRRSQHVGDVHARVHPADDRHAGRDGRSPRGDADRGRAAEPVRRKHAGGGRSHTGLERLAPRLRSRRALFVFRGIRSAFGRPAGSRVGRPR